MLVRSINRVDVELTFAELDRFFNESKWLGRSNRYSERTIQKISADLTTGKVRSPRQLAQYIAASSVLHCADGWSYLGRSILSLLQGDPHRTRHLAYYAELRAAMALLATEGIGIFKNRHFAMDGPNSVVRLDNKRGTHEFVWHCLEYWGRQQRSGDLFSAIITPSGRALDDWFVPLGGGRVVAAQAQVWFRQWGMDLRTFPDDRDARHTSSYRPDGIPSSWYLTAADVLNFVREIWGILQPSTNSRFDAIDMHILRIALETTFRGRTGTEPAKERSNFGSWIQTIVAYQSLSPDIAAYWNQLLNRDVEPDDSAIFSWSSKSADIQATSHFAMISRAALLLRIASGSTSRVLNRAGISANSLEFWWDNFGKARGIWDGARDRGALTDLWADVEPALNDIDAFKSKFLEHEQTFFRIGNELSRALPILASCERVAIWGLTA